jgi:glycosyltransferase involved in cell wall biosynthesis
MSRNLTIVVPAFNEERKLPATVREALAEAARGLDAYEVIVVNDGSSDRTGEVADGLARESAAVRVVHQPVNRGVGAAYYAALRLARHEYITLVPGDNAFHHSGLRTLFAAVGQADLVISYRQNMQARTPLRRFLSRCCNRAMRLLTGCAIRDAHSMFVFPTAEARRLPVTDGYTYHMRALAALLRRVGSYVEVPVTLNPKPDASSGVMRMRTLLALGGTLSWLYLCRFTVGLLHRHRPVRREPPLSSGPECGRAKAA